MPYLILILGLLIGFYALYRFFLKANVKQVKALFLTALMLTLCVALFYLAVTGRLAAALGLIVAIIPFVIGYVRHKAPDENISLSRKEAFEILGLKEGADEKDIKTAYKNLMKKIHPDHEGSEWMAAKLNAAKDLLLK